MDANIEVWEDKNHMQTAFLQISHLYFKRVFKQLADTEVHPGQVPMINLLAGSNGLSQQEIARILNIKPPTVNVSIKRMEKAGLVEKRRDEGNQKILKVYLTDIGETFHKKIVTLLEENEKIMFRGFSESEICLMKRLFHQVIVNLESISE